MRYIITLLFFHFLPLSSLIAQNEPLEVKGRVYDTETGEGLPFVNITIGNTGLGVASDLDGHFEINSPKPIFILNFSFIGYEKKKITITGDSLNLNVGLTSKSDELAEAVVFPGVNPAHRIIQNAVKNRELNNPESIRAFSYKTYNKFFLTLNTDSLNSFPDSVASGKNDSTLTSADSSDYRLSKFLEDKYFFFMETVTQRQYLAPNRDNETVLASRVSGFKNPMFSLIFTQMQSFSFYRDYINIGGGEYLNPITRGSTSRYLFLIEDTTYNSSTDTVFVISFRPRQNSGFRAMEGLLYITSTDWALQNVIAGPYEDQEAINIRIQQQYKRYGEHSWFPIQLNADIGLPLVSVNNKLIIGKMRTYLKEIDLNAELKKKQISRADISIDEGATVRPEILLDKYRTDTLSSKEKETYTYIDSVSKEENFERALKIFTTISTGKIPVYFVDLETDKIFRFNNYEGFRLGIGGHTNSRFSRWFKIGGYYGYGLKDKVSKYGWDAEVTLQKYTNLKLVGGYRFDIFESGGVDFLQKKRMGLLADNYRILYIPQWDETTRYWGGLTYDIFPKVHTEIRLQRENRFTIGDYFFQYNDGSETGLQNGFTFSELITSIRYTPNEKYIEGPTFGKLSWEGNYPILYFQYTRGIANLFDSDFEYNKFDMRLEHLIKTIRLGTITLGVQAGIVLADLPFSKLYAGPSGMIDSKDIKDRYGMIADRNSFETMRFNEFLSDRYAQFFFRQDLKSLLFRRKDFAPHIEIVSRAMWGDLSTPQLHQNISTTALSRGYYESGLEINKLFVLNFMGFGIGSYYRYGPYALSSFADNFAVKITSKFSL